MKLCEKIWRPIMSPTGVHLLHLLQRPEEWACDVKVDDGSEVQFTPYKVEHQPSGVKLWIANGRFCLQPMYRTGAMDVVSNVACLNLADRCVLWPLVKPILDAARRRATDALERRIARAAEEQAARHGGTP